MAGEAVAVLARQRYVADLSPDLHQEDRPAEEPSAPSPGKGGAQPRAATHGNFMEVAQRSKAKPAHRLHLKRSSPTSDREASHRGAPARPGPSASSSSRVTQTFAAPQGGEGAHACQRVCGVPCNQAAEHCCGRSGLMAQEEAAHWDHGMVIQALAVAVISAALTNAAAREAAAARERREAEAATREAEAAGEARTAQEAIVNKELEVKVLDQALAEERARKKADMRPQVDAAKRDAIETGRRKVAHGKAKTEAGIRTLEAEDDRLEQQRKRDPTCAHEEAKKEAAEANGATMEGAERKIQRETPPRGSRVDTLRRFFDADAASRMRMDLDAEDSRSSEGSVPLTCPRCKGKGKTPERP